MLVDDIGDVTITYDGATILRMLEVEHPAAKILVELAELQDPEVGDGTTSVVIIAVELLKSANELVRNKIHPTSIISGYRLAMCDACKYVEEKLSVKVDKLGKDFLVNCAKTSMSSKLIHIDRDFFANLLAMHDACRYVEEKLSVKVDKLGKDSLVNCAKTGMSLKFIHSDRDFFANLMVEIATHVDVSPCEYSLGSQPDGTPDGYKCSIDVDLWVYSLRSQPADTPDSYDYRLGDCRTLDYATLGDLVFSRIYRSGSQIGWSKDKCLERNKMQKIWDGLSLVDDKYIYKVNQTKCHEIEYFINQLQKKSYIKPYQL
ncbi:T-complex protein 1 subunit alpha-like [Hordeum vulgare]|nr:T-complex protein 1 subunit alpha-like [Hordeum vulgare]